MRRGVTRLEIIVVLSIGICVAGLAVMLIARHRENAVRLQCSDNLRRIGKAVHGYHDNNRQSLPPSYLADGYATWAVFLAPHMLKDHPLERWDLQQSYFAQPEEVRESRLIYYFCPARVRTDTLSRSGDLDAGNKHWPGGLGDYASVAGDRAEDWTGPKATGALLVADILERKEERILKWQSRTGLRSLNDNQSYTMLIGEKHVPADHLGEGEFGDGSLYNGNNHASFSRIAGPGFPLAAGPDAPFNKNFGSYHHGICHFLMADASVRAMTNDTSEFVLGELARRH